MATATLPRTIFRLTDGQFKATSGRTGNQVILGPGGSGKSFALRVISILAAAAHPGLSIALLAPTREGLRRDHLEGPRGLPALLSDMQRHGAVEVGPDEARFANGSTAWWTGSHLGAEISAIRRRSIDLVMIDDAQRVDSEIAADLAAKVAISSADGGGRVVLAAESRPSWADPAAEEVTLGADELRALPDPPPIKESPPTDPVEWVQTMWPQTFGLEMAPFQVDFWHWVWSVLPGLRPPPRVEIWARDSGKTTSLEGAVCALAARGARRYAVYVRATQAMADRSVNAIAALLGAPEFSRHYPELATRAVNRYGAARGWRRDRLVTSAGFVVDGLGFNAPFRGMKDEEQRPDLIILDDLDDRHDSPAASARKLEVLRDSILPAGASHAAIAGGQNLIIEHGIFSALAGDAADFLLDRQVSGPHPEVEDLTFEQREEENGRISFAITGGKPTWAARGLSAAQAHLTTYGPRTYLREFQHEIYGREGALWISEMIRYCRPPALDDLVEVAWGIDPAGGGTETGLVGAGLLADGTGVVLDDVSTPPGTPALTWALAAIDNVRNWGGDDLVAEVNYGGNMVESTLTTATPEGESMPRVHVITATRGKRPRAEPVAALYSRGMVWHAGVFPELEHEMRNWVPGDRQSPNRMDALVWALTWLMIRKKKRPLVVY